VAKPVEWAADLAEKLEQSGTSRELVHCLKKAVRKFYDERPKLKSNDPERHMTAVEARQLLVDWGSDSGKEHCVGDMTLKKVDAFMTVGEFHWILDEANTPFELPQPPKVPAPARAVVAEVKPELKQFAGVVEGGITETSTIGMKPFIGRMAETPAPSA
jgi:hypothetical protein